MTKRTLMLIGLIVACPGMASAASDLSFRVWLDDRPVGRHSLRILHQDAGVKLPRGLR